MLCLSHRVIVNTPHQLVNVSSGFAVLVKYLLTMVFGVAADRKLVQDLMLIVVISRSDLLLMSFLSFLLRGNPSRFSSSGCLLCVFLGLFFSYFTGRFLSRLSRCFFLRCFPGCFSSLSFFSSLLCSSCSCLLFGFLCSLFCSSLSLKLFHLCLELSHVIVCTGTGE